MTLGSTNTSSFEREDSTNKKLGAAGHQEKVAKTGTFANRPPHVLADPACQLQDRRRLSANVVSEGLAGTDAKQYSFFVGS